MNPPSDRFYGDPFLFKKDGCNFLLFEDYRYATGKGVISYVEVDDAGNWGEPELALERPYHLSYPFVFESGGQIYLLPETSANRTIELYRAADFPKHWVLDRILMAGVRAVDATVVWYHEKFWLFTSLAAEGSTNTGELHLFFADALQGPWQPHPKNPIVSDVRRARPAGRLFSARGQLFRPAQDCSVRYGYAIVFQRIEVLSETDYREAPAGRIGPEWLPGNLATHTFDCNEDFEVLDARIQVFDPRWRFGLRSTSGRLPKTGPNGECYGSSITTPLDEGSMRTVGVDNGRRPVEVGQTE
jgi:hypothetical protein